MTLIFIGISFSLISAIMFCRLETERKGWHINDAPRVKTTIKLGESK
jgi:hypothetical protein